MVALRAEGNRIVRVDNRAPVLLRGINWSGLEYSRRAVPPQHLEVIIRTWGANVVRLPFNQDWALNDADYPSLIDQAIESAAALGAYTLLDLHWLDATTVRGHTPDGRTNFVPPLPNEASVLVWRALARRYRLQPAVLYDIFNEPHDPLADDLAPGPRQVTMAEWQPWACSLIEAIRTENANALIVVPGTDWGYDLSGFPIPGTSGVVYGTHVYPNKDPGWDKAFGDLAATHPVLVTEWGGTERDLKWGRALAAYLEQRGIGWTAWSWSDWPHLVRQPAAPAYVATQFGGLIHELLTLSPRPCL